MKIDIAHILGPGGAGKSTVGALLSINHGLTVVDMDAYFMDNSGGISEYISDNGYAAYALKNFENYLSIVSKVLNPTIVVVSSGFMTYPHNLAPGYAEVVQKISKSELSALLLPSLETEKCIEIIVQRQLQRTYLNVDIEREEAKIRQRLPLFMEFKCKHFLSDIPPEELAIQLSAFFIAKLSEEKVVGN